MIEDKMTEMLKAHFFRTMDGIPLSLNDFLFLDVAIEASSVFGLTKRMGRTLSRSSGSGGSSEENLILACRRRKNGCERRRERDFLKWWSRRWRVHRCA